MMKNISLDDVSKLLPAPDATLPTDEAFELRWLKSEFALGELITIYIADDMVRATFPTDSNNGRGRVWLHRPNRKITSVDLHGFLMICVGISKLGDLKIWLSTRMQEKLHQKAQDAFMALNCVELESRYSRDISKALRAFDADARQAEMSLEEYVQYVIYTPDLQMLGR